jgi:streptogramin lyase
VVLISAAGARADVYGLVPGGGLPPFTNQGFATFNAAGEFVRRVPAGGESADGIAVTPDGFVYVAGNILGSGFLDRAGVGNVDSWQVVSPSNAPTPYNAPGGLAAGPDGSVYATSTAFYAGAVTGVFRYNPADGSFAPVVVNPSPGPRPFANFNHSVALSPGGDIYLGRRGIGIERYTGSNGQFVGLVVPSASIGTAAEDFDFGPDGNLYVPTSTGVDRFNAQTGALIDHFIPNGAGGLNGATSLAFGDGLLYANSPAANSILRYDAATGAFRDVYVAPAQYRLATPGGLGRIVYVVPEPGAIAGLAGAAAALLLRRRRRWQRAAAAIADEAPAQFPEFNCIALDVASASAYHATW